MLIIVVVVFAVCWLPIHVYQMHAGLALALRGFWESWDPYVLVYICYWLSQANSAINPWLYIGLNGKMKAAFKNLIRCRHEEITGRVQPALALTTRKKQKEFHKKIEAKM